MSLYDRDTGKATVTQNKRNRFASIGNNICKIATRFHQDDELVKLLVRNDRSLEGSDKPTAEERNKALTKSIITKPVVDKELDLSTFLIIQPIQGLPFGHGASGTKLVLSFDIICNFDVWELEGNETRPIAIMNVIERLIGDTKMDSFGMVEFMGFNSIMVDERHAGYHMEYLVGQE